MKLDGVCGNCDSENTETYVNTRKEYCLDCKNEVINSNDYWIELEKSYRRNL